jgi:hypothetical protein
MSEGRAETKAEVGFKNERNSRKSSIKFENISEFSRFWFDKK